LQRRHNLQLIAPAEVTEGQSAVLTCKTTCSLTDPTFIWYKNSRDLTTNTIKSNKLHLQPVSSEDAGSYSCAVGGYERLPSPARNLSVRYPPKNVSVSINSSGEILGDGSVTLTCSSDANPPVENYTWFKVNESSAVGSGQSYRALQSGQYYCQAQNKHGSDRSAAVSVTLHGFQRIVYAGVGVVVFVCICFIFTFFIIRKKKRTGSAEDQRLKQNDFSTNTAVNPINPPTDSASNKQDEVLYTSLVCQNAADSRNTAERSALKASVSEEEEVQYASVRFTHAGADY
ncbi:B-cell receptor CD22-like, partial [Clarias magur]